MRFNDWFSGMSKQVIISTPLEAGTVRQLHAGDEVIMSGTVLTARDQAHRRLCDCIAEGKRLPVSLKGSIIYYVGPTPPAPGRVIGAAGPTTSSRMDAFAPVLYAAGVRGTIGKGRRDRTVREALVRHEAVHFSALGGAGALLSKHITACKVIAYEELGAEAVYELQFANFPAVVAYDCFGYSIYGEPEL
jgi:fumarate hydratase subunit beta